MMTPARIVARFLRADLSPPLGYPGGPCQVVQRIDQQVRNPKLKDDLKQEIEEGDSLTNPEAAKVYHQEAEHGAGIARSLQIGVHAQYRMDLRGITVPEVRAAFQSFTKRLNDWKSQGRPEYKRAMEDLGRGEGVRWTDNRLGLTIVFGMRAPGLANLITVFRPDDPKPRPPKPGECDLP